MSSQRFVQTLAGNALVNNLLAGTDLEFVMGRPQRVMIAAVADPTETTEMEVRFNSVLVLRASPLPSSSAAGFGPTLPDDVLVDKVAPAGTRVTIQLRNATAVNADSRVLVDIG